MEIAGSALPGKHESSPAGGVYDHEVEEGFFLSLFDHDLAESVILDCPIAEN
jgi:hypothetical protein